MVWGGGGGGGGVVISWCLPFLSISALHPPPPFPHTLSVLPSSQGSSRGRRGGGGGGGIVFPWCLLVHPPAPSPSLPLLSSSQCQNGRLCGLSSPGVCYSFHQPLPTFPLPVRAAMIRNAKFTFAAIAFSVCFLPIRFFLCVFSQSRFSCVFFLYGFFCVFSPNPVFRVFSSYTFFFCVCVFSQSRFPCVFFLYGFSVCPPQLRFLCSESHRITHGRVPIWRVLADHPHRLRSVPGPRADGHPTVPHPEETHRRRVRTRRKRGKPCA